MAHKTKLIAVGLLAILAALLLSACGVVQRPAISQPTAAPGYGSGPGGMMGGGMGGMMNSGPPS